eukprot:16113_1
MEIHVTDVAELFAVQRSDKYNEVAIISQETMDKLKLEPGFLVIDNLNGKRSDIVTLMSKDIDNHDRIYINKTTMNNCNVHSNNKVKIHNIPATNNKFKIAQTVTIKPYEDSTSNSSNTIFRSYLQPYFQPNPEINANKIVKRGNKIFISDKNNNNEKKFQVIDFKLTDINEEKEDHQDFDFCMINNSTLIQCDGKPLKNRKDKNKKSIKLMVNNLEELEIDSNDTYKYNTVALISQYDMDELSINDGDIIFVKGKKGKILYCRAQTINDTSSKDGFIFMNRIMQINLRVTACDDHIFVSINRACKLMIDKFAARIFVTPILGDDQHDNDDYNREDILIKQYLEPYFKPSKATKSVVKSDNDEKNDIVDDYFFQNIIIGEKYIFETKHVENESKTIQFIVEELEVNDDVDWQNCVINKQTQIECDISGVEQSEIFNFDENGYDDIGDCDEQIDKVNEIIRLSLQNPSILYSIGQKPTTGVLFYGPPGTGKTLLAKAIASETNYCMIPIKAPDIISSEIGESERKLKKAFKYASNNAPGIVFIDEIDAILCYNNIKSALVALMDGFNTNKGVLVIAATNKINQIDVSLRRGGLFEEEIRFNVPDEPGRDKILHILTKKMQSNMENMDDQTEYNKFIKWIASKTHGYVGADLDQLCKTAAKFAIAKHHDTEEEDFTGTITKNNFEEALKIIAPSSVKDVVAEKPNITWDDIGGLENTKKQMIQMIENPLKFGHIYSMYGSAGSRGCLLWGPPGTGKTLLAKAIANKCDTNFIYIK